MRHTIFGESHGPAIGVVLEGVPAGVEVDLDFIQSELARRAPGKSPLSTPRSEKDEVKILSGVFEGKTTGTPLCMLIENTDTRSKDYETTRHLMRPSHADYTALVRYEGFADYRGGGHFSGRLTAPLVAAGALAKLILRARGITVGAHIAEIGGIADDALPLCPEAELLAGLATKEFPVLNDAQGAAIQEVILAARQECDSVGGKVECAVVGLPAGVGAPDLGQNAEGIFSSQLFAIPGVKAVGFGAGEEFARMRGSRANDPFAMENGKVVTTTNHSGGINGGITNGMPLVCTATFRPTPSIGQTQQTVDVKAGENAPLTIQGRHDPCIVHRAVPVVEAACALAACQLLGI